MYETILVGPGADFNRPPCGGALHSQNTRCQEEVGL